MALLLALCALVTALMLGNWQSRRGDAKEALQAQWDALSRSVPRPITARDLTDASVPLPSRVQVSGRFDPSQAVWLQNRTFEGRAGFGLVMPLVVAPGVTVLVHRGWVPRDPADLTALPPVRTPTDVVTIDGVALRELPRLLELGQGGERGPLPAIWQNLDPAAFAQASGRAVVPLVIQQTDPDDGDGLRRAWPRPAIDVSRNRGYAFQWYALAVAIGLGVLRFTVGKVALVRAWTALQSSWAAHRGRWTLLLLALVCVVPVVASYLVYYVFPPEGRTNYGVLVEPQRPLPPLALRHLDGSAFDPAELKGRWTLLAVDRSGCAADCARKLWNMRQVRTATGRERERIARVLLLLDEAPLDTMVLREYDGTLFLRARAPEVGGWIGESTEPPADAAGGPLWLVDPLGHLMLRWPVQVDPARMKRDVDRLLRASRVG